MRLRQCVALILVIGNTGAAAQDVPVPQPREETRIDQAPADATDAATNGPGESLSQPRRLPQLPETEVVAEPFPLVPLTSDVALTPTRSVTPRSQIGSSVTVITEDQIRNSGERSLLGVLRTVPGLDIVRSGGYGQQTSGFVRGANSDHTKVLLDGMPINDPSNPNRAFDFANFSLNNVERVEVLRGPQSTLYGSEAIGGVINIVTKRGDGPMRYLFRSTGGSFSTFEQTANASGGTENAWFSLGGSWFDTKGFSAAREANGNPEKDPYRNATVSGRFGLAPHENLNVDVIVRYRDTDAHIDGFLIDNIGRKLLSEALYTRVQTGLSLFDGRLQQTAGFSYADFDRLDTTPGPFDTAEFHGDTARFDWQANLLLADQNHYRNTLTTGVEYQDETARTSRLASQSLYNRAIFLQERIELWNRWFTTFGVRMDDYSQAGSANTYRVTSRYIARQCGSAVHGSFGTGFRAPSINQLFGVPFNNPNLQPEGSRGWDVGIEQQLEDGQIVLDATYFRNDFTGLVNFAVDPLGNFLPFNVDRAFAAGVELSGRVELSRRTGIFASYTRTETRDLNTGLRLLRRPLNKFNIGFNRRCLTDRANINVRWRWIGDRVDVDETGTRIVLNDYSILDAAFWYALNDNVRMFVRAENVFDEDYEEVFGFGIQPASVFAGVELVLGGH